MRLQKTCGYDGALAGRSEFGCAEFQVAEYGSSGVGGEGGPTRESREPKTLPAHCICWRKTGASLPARAMQLACRLAPHMKLWHDDDKSIL